MHLRRHDTIDVDDRKGWKHNGLRGVEGANVCIGDLALFGELAALAAWVRNYAARGARGCNVRKGYFARIGGARMGGEGSTSYFLAVCDTILYSVTNRAAYGFSRGECRPPHEQHGRAPWRRLAPPVP